MGQSKYKGKVSCFMKELQSIATFHLRFLLKLSLMTLINVHSNIAISYPSTIYVTYTTDCILTYLHLLLPCGIDEDVFCSDAFLFTSIVFCNTSKVGICQIFRDYNSLFFFSREVYWNSQFVPLDIWIWQPLSSTY